MSLALDILTLAASLAGVFFFIAGAVGLMRFPDIHTRLHALATADNAGLTLIVLALLPQVDGVLEGLKLLVVWALAIVAAAVVAQLVGRAARGDGGPMGRRPE